MEEARVRNVTTNENKERHKLENLEKTKVRAEERAVAKKDKEDMKIVKEDGWSNKLHHMIKESIKKPCCESMTCL